MSKPTKQILTGRAIFETLDSIKLLEAMAVADVYVQLISWPTPQISASDPLRELDRALEDLYGYDWLIFINHSAVRFFLSGLRKAGHDVSELDALKVCAIGEGSLAALEDSHIHVDIATTKTHEDLIVAELESYLGQPEPLAGLNFLIPHARISQDPLASTLVLRGARADTVEVYRTAPAGDLSVTKLETVLTNGGIDGALFTSADEVRELAILFDTNDLGRLLKQVPVFVIDSSTQETAARFGLRSTIISPAADFPSTFGDFLKTYFSH